MTKIKEVIVSTGELAGLFDVADKYISQLVLEHGLPKIAKNKFNLYDCVKWRFGYLNENHKQEVERIRSDKPQDILAIKSAEYKDLLIREKRGELVQASLVGDSWLNEVSVINAELDGFSIKAAPNLLGIKNVKTMTRKLAKEINKVKTKIAKLKLHTAGPK